MPEAELARVDECDRSIPRRETIRGTHWQKTPFGCLDLASRNPSWQRSCATATTDRTYDRKRSDSHEQTLATRGPSTYGSLLSQGRRLGLARRAGWSRRRNPPLHYRRTTGRDLQIRLEAASPIVWVDGGLRLRLQPALRTDISTAIAATRLYKTAHFAELGGVVGSQMRDAQAG